MHAGDCKLQVIESCYLEMHAWSGELLFEIVHLKSVRTLLFFCRDVLNESDGEQGAESRRSKRKNRRERLHETSSGGRRSTRASRIGIRRDGRISIPTTRSENPKIRHLPISIPVRRAIIADLERASGELRRASTRIVRVRRPISTERDIKHKAHRAEIGMAAVRDWEVDRRRAPAARIDGIATCAQICGDLRLRPVPDADTVSGGTERAFGCEEAAAGAVERGAPRCGRGAV